MGEGMSVTFQKAAAILVLTAGSISAAAAFAQESEIQEVTVTATRRSENLQNVPVAVSALTGDKLADTGIGDQLELTQQVPGVEMAIAGATLTPFIRGVGALNAGAGQESASATYIDGVFIESPGAIMLGFNNLERVEVLKGPQGTLFGRNADSGVVQLITREPTANTNAYGAVSYGNYQTTRANLYATTGFGDQLAGDLSVNYSNQNAGYGVNVDTGLQFGQKKETLLRSKWVYTPLDDTKLTIWASYANARHSADSAKQLIPGVVALDGVTTATNNYYNITGDVTPSMEFLSHVFAATLEHDFGPLLVKNISSYQSLTTHQIFDNDFTRSAIVDVDVNFESYKTITEELQILSSPQSPIRWIVGGFFMHDQSGYQGPLGLGLFGSGVGGGVGIRNYILTRSFAGFADATIPILEDTNLSVGARYTRDERELMGSTYIFASDTDRTKVATIPLDPSVSAAFTKPTYRAVLDHRFNDQFLVYAGYSTGFKSGNFNTVNSANPAFRPESLDSVEVGIKTDLFSRRLRVNASAFHYRYRDIQLTAYVGNSEETLNAASAKVSGGEIEGTAIITENLETNFGVSILDGKIGSFTNGICFYPNPAGGNSQVTCDSSGNRLPHAPRATFNIAPTLVLPVLGGKLRATLAYKYNSGFYWDYSQTAKEDAYSTLNGSVGWSTDDDRIGVRLFGTNLTGTKYSIFTNLQGSGTAYTAAPPLMYGLEVNFKWNATHR
jgi:iron complex outermembrane recepter protein